MINIAAAAEITAALDATRAALDAARAARSDALYAA